MSLEEKYHNVNVTFRMAYTVDTLNPEDVINEDYVEYQESENLDVEPFEEVAGQLLDDELDDSLIYHYQMLTIIEHTCDDIGSLFYNGTAPFDGGTPYEAFHSDCLSKLNI